MIRKIPRVAILVALLVRAQLTGQNDDASPPERLIDIEPVERALKDEAWIVVDVRSTDAYNGWALDGARRGGHIPGSVDFPASWIDTKVVSDQDRAHRLDEVLRDKGITAKKHVVLTSHHSAERRRVRAFLGKRGFRNLYAFDLATWIDDPKRELRRYPNFHLLVPPVVVKRLLDGERPETFETAKRLRFLEVSWGHESKSYAKGHVPRSVHVNTDHFEPPPSWALGSADVLNAFARKYDLRFDDTVILSGEDPTASYRLAIVLRYMGTRDVRVLNGGLAAWKAAGYPVETIRSEVTSGNGFGIPIPKDTKLIDSIGRAREVLDATTTSTLVDTRSWVEFVGESSGYEYHEQKGRIPGAIYAQAEFRGKNSLTPYRNLDGTMRRPEEILAMWKRAGIDTRKHLSFFCGGGWRAAEVLTFAQVAGLEQVSLFSAGWIGWSKDPTNAVEQDDPSLGHPRTNYSIYSDAEIALQAAAVRKSRPQMSRGGWEWDRLLSRYVDGGRKERNALTILHAYFLSMLDRYYEAQKKGGGETFSLFNNHKSWGSGGRMRIFAELLAQDAITEKEKADFTQIVRQSFAVGFPDYSKIERGVNNRPYGINSGPAIAVRMFPEMPNAIRHRPWLDALWRELIEYGDTTETNYYPYGPLFLHGFLDMAEGMGKLETDYDLIYAIAKRYLDYVHGGGVRGNPNSGCFALRDRETIYANPWNAEYYGGAERVNDGHAWYRLAKIFQDPEFLWASEQVLLGGLPPDGRAVPPAYEEAYAERYFWFKERGISPRVPTGGSKIGYLSPLKHKVPERLYLCPSRESGAPFVSFFIYDRNNNYMHYCDDSDGKLYEYAVDGAKFLHVSGKYSSGRAGVGETSYDMLSVLPPDVDFPMGDDGKMGSTSPNTWKMSSMSLKVALNCRDAPDSKNWVLDEKIHLFRRTDQPELGYAHGNMDGYWYLNNAYRLTSVDMGTFGSGSQIQNIRIAGPAGEKILVAGDTLPKNLKLVLHQGDERRTLAGEERLRAASSAQGGRRPGKSLRVAVPEGARLGIILEGLDESFDGQNEYTRVSYDFRGDGGSIRLNDRTHPRYFTPLYHRGAILVRDALKAENHDDDSFGQFRYRNFYGSDCEWTRQALLTVEGILIVRDAYQPGIDVDGYHASPGWMLKAEGEPKNDGSHWFDAPARDHAWWQEQKKRILLYLHPGEGLSIGQKAHRASQDIKSGAIHNTFARATLRAGREQIWLSVLVPFNEGDDASKLAKTISTELLENGTARVRIGHVKASIDALGSWRVER